MEDSAARLLARRRDDVLATLRGFAAAADTADAETSTSARACPEDACPALELLDESSNARDDACTLAALTHLKILARDAATRAAFGERGVRTLVRVLKAIDQSLFAMKVTPKGPVSRERATGILLAAEGANVALNACHHPESVAAFAEAGGVKTLLRWLDHETTTEHAGGGDGEDGGDDGNDSRERVLRASGRRTEAVDSPSAALRRNAAGALQSVCFEPAGRAAAARERTASKVTLAALKVAVGGSGGGVNDGKKAHDAVPDPVLAARLTGALHNATADAACVRLVRAAGQGGGVALLVSLLRSGDAGRGGAGGGRGAEPGARAPGARGGAARGRGRGARGPARRRNNLGEGARRRRAGQPAGAGAERRGGEGARLRRLRKRFRRPARECRAESRRRRRFRRRATPRAGEAPLLRAGVIDGVGDDTRRAAETPLQRGVILRGAS